MDYNLFEGLKHRLKSLVYDYLQGGIWPLPRTIHTPARKRYRLSRRRILRVVVKSNFLDSWDGLDFKIRFNIYVYVRTSCACVESIIPLAIKR